MAFDQGTDRKLRSRHGRRHYAEDDPLIEEEVEHLETTRSFSVEEKLTSDKFDESFVKFMNGNELNIDFVRRNGFFTPFVFKEKCGLGLRVPPKGFTVKDVKELIGEKRIVDVMDVSSQQALEMFLDDWVDYYTAPERQYLLNVISLEFSHTPMEHMVQSPRVVRDLDWVDIYWPAHLKKAQKEGTNDMASMKYPKVQKYCLMSVGGCYTDFHIDFGGTSVWYHLVKGEKVFWLIPPTPQNLAIYEKWVKSGRQQDIFLGDMVEKCGKIHLYEGYTFMIPTGWIHAVYTPCDSLVFGGNFLHSYNIEGQLIVSDIEDRTKVPHKFRYPFFVEILWHVIDQYAVQLESLSSLDDPEALPADELTVTESGESVHPTEIDQLSMYEIRGLLSLLAKMEKTPSWKRRAPKAVGNPNDLLARMRELMNGYKIQYGYMSSLWKDEQMRLTSTVVMPHNDTEDDTNTGHSETSDTFGDHVYWKPPDVAARLQSQKRARIPRYIESDTLDVEDDWMDTELIAFASHRQQSGILDEEADDDDDYTPKEREKPQVQRSSSTTTNKKYKRKHRCGECVGCLANECRKCRFCLDMPKYGGSGRLRQACIKRKCIAMIGGSVRSEWPGEKLLSPTSSSHPQNKSQRRPRGIRATFSNKAKRLKSETKRERHSDNWPVPDISHHEGSVSTPYPDLGSLEGSSELFPDSAITPLELDENDLGIMMSDVCGLAPDDIELSEIVHSVPVYQKTVSAGGSSSTNWKSRQTASKQVQDLLEGRGVSSQRDMHNKKPKRKKKPGKTFVKGSHTKRKGTDLKVSGDPVHQMAEANRVKSSFKIPKRCDNGSQTKVSSLPSPPSASQPPPHLPSLIHCRSTDQLSNPHHSDRHSSEQRTSQPTLISPEHRKLPQHKSKSFPQWERRKPETNQVDGKKDPRRTNVMASESHRHAQMKKSTGSRAGTGTVVDADLEVNGLARKQWLLIFSYLSQPDLCNCMLVCQAFHAWAQDPCFWHSLNLSRIETITAPMLTGIKKRQPRVLDLSWTAVTQKQLQWLLKKLTLLNRLCLAGCSKAVLPALVDCSPFPPIRILDLGWVDGLDDHSVQGLLVAPSRSTERPVSVKQLRSLKELRLTGSPITDASMQLISRHSACLVKLDCSYCSCLTDHAIEWLTSVGSPSRNTLQDIDLSGCSKLTDMCIHYFSRCSQLSRLDLRLCEEVSERACERLVASSNLPLTLKQEKLIQRSERIQSLSDN